MTKIWNVLQSALWNLLHRTGPKDILDILIVTILIYGLIRLTRQTRSSAVIKGLLLLGLSAVISTLLGLTTLNWIMRYILNNSAMVLLVLFQPELRKALEAFGRGAIVHHGPGTAEGEQKRIINEIVKTANDLSRRKVGALIVFERRIGLRDIIETGTRIDARISAALLENIFEPKTPLHDGAVVISGPSVVAGACILPLTDNHNVDMSLGTRHRSAIGVSEATDALVLVVSEETGTISLCKSGTIERDVDSVRLHEELGRLYTQEDRRLIALLRGNRGKEAAK